MSPALPGAPAPEAGFARRTEDGLEFRFRPRGAGRFLGAAFLAVWLCGWAVGEAFAVWFLVRGALALATGQPPTPEREPLAPAPALAAGLFLMVWLTIWTAGGLLALRELLRALWAEDRLIVGAADLVRESRLGPFRARRAFARPEVTGVRLERRTARSRSKPRRPEWS